MKIPAPRLPGPARAASGCEGRPESLGTVAFSVACAPSVRAQFVRGVALLHDFWYQEAERQFQQIAKTDPKCAMASWGVAMSIYHQIWDRPDDGTMARGWRELQAAEKHPAKTARERAYIAALSDFYRPGAQGYQARVAAYAAAMGKLYAANPSDTDAGAFYALALLASTAPTDDSLRLNHQAMAVLTPLFAKYPDHRASFTTSFTRVTRPSMAQGGLAAAKHYGEIAASAPHAVHMPDIFFRAWGCGRGHRCQRRFGWPLRMPRRAASRAARWISFTRTISWCMPTCKAAKRRAPRQCWTIPRRR